MEKKIDAIQQYFYNNPSSFGLLFSFLGLIWFIAVMLDKDWPLTFGFGNTWLNSNNTKLYFGRKGLRIVVAIMSLIAILVGVLYYLLG